MCVLDFGLRLVDYAFHYLKGIAWPLKEPEKQKYLNGCIRFRVRVG
jgi:hypothetical protein